MSNEAMVQVPAALLQGMVSFIEKAGSELQQAEAEREQVKEAAPAVVDTLIKQGLLDEGSRSAATEKLAESHASTIESLRRTASHVTVQSMGESAPAGGMGKAASAGVPDASPVDAADRNFLTAVGF